MIARISKRLREEIDTTSSKILNGNFSDFTGAMILVERRKTLLNAVEIINEVIKLDPEDD